MQTFQSGFKDATEDCRGNSTPVERSGHFHKNPLYFLGKFGNDVVVRIRLIVELAAGLLAALPEIVSAVQTLVVDTAGEFMKPENLQPFVEAGKSLAQAVWSGITSLLNTSIFGNFIRGMLNSAGLGFLGTLGSIETWAQPGRSVSTSNSNLYISTSSVTPSTVDYIVNKSRTIPALR